MGTVKILLVEDDRGIISSLTEFLQGEGFSVASAAGQAAAVELLGREAFDLLLLDISLADGNGFAVLAAAKAHGAPAVIFLTAADDEYSVAMGLDMGADDYISKPFRPMELLARIRSVLRRCGKAGKLLEYEGLQLDMVRGGVKKDGRELFLSALEYRLLLAFFQHKGEILTRARLLEEIWDAAGDFVNDNTLTVYIKRLRDKIEDDPQNPAIIRTVRGLGYRLG